MAFITRQAAVSAVSSKASVRPVQLSSVRTARIVTRAQQGPEGNQAPVVEPTGSVAVAEPFSLLNATNEAINGRAAMMGFVSAVVAEAATHHSVFSQVAGKYVDGTLVEKAIGFSDLTFGMIVALVTMGTLAPKLIKNQSVDSTSFGPFTPGLEKSLGRLAMMGFAGLLVVEAVKGSSLF